MVITNDLLHRGTSTITSFSTPDHGRFPAHTQHVAPLPLTAHHPIATTGPLQVHDTHMSESPPSDWTTVLPRNRSMAPRAPSNGGTDNTHTRGRSSSRTRSSRGRASFGNLDTIHEDGARQRSRSAVNPPIPFTTGAPQFTLMTPLRASPSHGSTSSTTPWSTQNSTTLSTHTQGTGTSRTTPPGAAASVANDNGFFPPIPPYQELPEQRTPSQSASHILTMVMPKRVKDWTHKDFGPLSELTGRSVLASLFTDFAHAIHPDGLSTNQLRMIAQRARRTHPAKLLQLIKDRKKMLDYIRATLATAYPPLLEDFLSPSGTPDLVANDGLRSRIGDSRLTRGDLLQIILPFLQCYYSSDPGFGDVVRQMSLSEISKLVYTPGAVKQEMMTCKRTFHFDTPCWYSLSRPAERDTPASLDIAEGGDITSYPSLANMGFNVTDFCLLPPSTQKTQVLSALPTYLDKLLPPARVIEALVLIGATAPEEILPMLTADRFNTLMGLDHAEPSLPQSYRYRMIFKHDNQGGSRCWRGSPSTILAHWLQAVLPPLRTLGHTLTLTLSPHEVHQSDTTVSVDFLPHADDLHRYVYHTLPRPDKFKRFEVWLVSTCPSLGVNFFDDLDATAFASYKHLLQSHHVWVQHAESYLAETIPCVLLTHSISQDLDALIVAELHARMMQADLAFPTQDPPFYTTWCSVATSDSCHSTLAKCVMAHPTIAPALTTVMMNIPTPDEYPITGDYGFLPIPLPSPMGDEARIHAITVQSDFSHRLISTQISGLPPTDWFTSPAQRVPPSLTALVGDSWSSIIVHRGISQGQDTIQSPVIKLSTDESCTQCSLTAFQEDAEMLVKYTRLLFMALSTWAGETFTLTCHVSSAQILLREQAARVPTPHPHLTVDTSLRDEIRELRGLILAQAQAINNLASKLDDPGKTRQFEIHLDEVTTSVTGSITSTLSSASRTAMSQCQSFLASQSTTIASFFSEHSAQLSALYARSNSSDSRDTQFHNMIRTYSDSVTRREAEIPNLDLLRIAVENNTTQVSQLVSAISSPTTATPELTPTSPQLMEAPTHTGTTSDIPIDSTHGEDNTIPSTPEEHSVIPPSTVIQPTPTDSPIRSASPIALSPPTADLCTGCATPGGILRLCEDCHLFFHPTCLTEEVQSSDLLCSDCTENRQRASTRGRDDVPRGSSSSSSDSSSSSSTSSSNSDGNSPPTPAGIAPTGTTMPLRLSPRGLLPTR